MFTCPKHAKTLRSRGWSGAAWRLARRRPGARPRALERTAFTVVEMLIALSIMALLLAALALATHAAFQSCAENAKIAEVTQAARVVLHRIVTEVRTADAVLGETGRIRIIPPENDQGLTEIRYELTDSALYCRRVVNGHTTSVVLVPADGAVCVEGLGISRETDVDGEGVTYTKSLTAELALRSGDNVFRVSASACPRRNLGF